MMKKRSSYTKEFKLESLRLMRQSERPASEIARELGIRRNQLYKWQVLKLYLSPIFLAGATQDTSKFLFRRLGLEL